jgi:predicted DCC family thiol-disulfide oxidoreductase YuxK
MSIAPANSVTVFYDGACPLCVREVSVLRRLDGKRGRLRFQNVADPGAPISCDIAREKLLARFHVRRADGVVVDGAAAFIEAYAQIPYLSWMRPLGRVEILRRGLDRAYALFLKARPRLQRLAGGAKK